MKRIFIGLLLLASLVGASAQSVDLRVRLKGNTCPGGTNAHWSGHTFMPLTAVLSRMVFTTNSLGDHQHVWFTNGLTGEVLIDFIGTNDLAAPEPAFFFVRYPDTCGFDAHPLAWDAGIWLTDKSYDSGGTWVTESYTNFSQMYPGAVAGVWSVQPTKTPGESTIVILESIAGPAFPDEQLIPPVITRLPFVQAPEVKPPAPPWTDGPRMRYLIDPGIIMKIDATPDLNSPMTYAASLTSDATCLNAITFPQFSNASAAYFRLAITNAP